MPTIVVSGYYGAGNTGDEAILAAMLQELRSLAPGAEIVVISRNPAHTRAVHGVAAVGRSSWLTIWRLLGRADLFLSGGGGLLQDVYPRRGLPRSILYYLGLCALAKLRGCAVMIYAQGLGPMRRRLSLHLTRSVLNRVDLVSVRDEESRLFLHECGVVVPSVHLTADPVLAWRPAGVFPEMPGLAADAGTLVVALRPWLGGNEHLAAVAGALDLAVSRWGLTPLFLPFAPGGDERIGFLVKTMMREGDRAIVLPLMAPAEAYAVVSRASLVLAMRLHALIFAATAGLRPVGLAYDPKVAAFMRRIGLAGLALPLEANRDDIWRAMADARQSSGTGPLGDALTKLAELAKHNAVLAVRLLRESTARKV